MRIKYFLIGAVCVFSFFSFVSKSEAAILYLLPETKTPTVGQEFYVDMKVNTQDGFINASQATVKFPINVLEMTSVEKVGSIFNFWLEDPVISNENGNMRFMGGSSKGFSGEALQTVRMKFKAKGAGKADITVSDAVVTANDGQGTNILSMIEDTSVDVGGEKAPTSFQQVVVPPASAGVSPAGPSVPAVSTPPAPVQQPEQVTRPAVPAAGLPAKPKVTVPLYSDETRWYSRLGEVIALWDVPNDVTKIAVEIDHSPRTSPEQFEPVLVTGKNFGVLKEGIWYIHVQFKNNIGWGGVTHYKISIDAEAPLSLSKDPLSFVEISSTASDNPTPNIKYETQDGLSGVAKALIFIDKNDAISSTESSINLPIQKPGKHHLIVRVFDFAGNSIEGALDFEILPLPKPEIKFITNKVVQGDSLFINGTALPNAFVDIKITNSKNQIAVEKTANSDSLGNWENTIGDLSAQDDYTLTLTARDQRGAISYPTDAQIVKVKAKTVLSIGGLDFSIGGLFLMSMILIIGAAGFIGWKYTLMQTRRRAYGIIAETDINKFAEMIGKELKIIEAENKKDTNIDKGAQTTIEFKLKEIRDILSRMRKHLGAEVKK